MEEYKSIERQNTVTEETNGNGANIFSHYGKPLQNLLKKIAIFICYGPGVVGFLWLIGRILKR